MGLVGRGLEGWHNTDEKWNKRTFLEGDWRGSRFGMGLDGEIE